MLQIQNPIVFDTFRVDYIHIDIGRNEGVVKAKISFVDSEGHVLRHELVQIPNGIPFLKNFIPDLKVLFDRIDLWLQTQYNNSTIIPNDDITV